MNASVKPIDTITAAADAVVSRAEARFDAHRQDILRSTDRMFAALLVGQWVFAIFLALTVSPYAWQGKVKTVHVHVWAAILLGGAITCVPVALAMLRPGALLTRHVIAAAQMFWSALLIHLTGGRIETHFHVFGSLAFLAFYRDWPVLLSASAVVGVDHYLRGLYFPESVYGVALAGEWRWLEHVWWVFFEDVFLLMAIRQSIQEMRAIAE